MTKLLAVLLVVAACGNAPAKPDAAADAPRPIDAMLDAAPDAPPDADAPDLSCLGQPPPTTAPDPLPVAGKLFAIVDYNVSPIAGAIVTVARRSDGAALAQATTAADGAFAASLASGGAAVDAVFTANVAGSRPTRVDPGEPLSGGEDALMVAATDAELARWYADANIPHADGDGALIVVVADCARRTIAGSTVAVTSGTVTYYDDVAKRWDPQLAASTNGFAFVTGAAIDATVTARSGSAQFPPHAVHAPSGTLTIAVATPRT